MIRTATKKTAATTPAKPDTEAKAKKGRQSRRAAEAEASKPKRGTGTAARRQTKKQQLIETLQAKEGADLQAICTATGWQTHTVRAALSRLKAEGYTIAREPGTVGAPSRYRIVATPAASAAPAGATEATAGTPS